MAAQSLSRSVARPLTDLLRGLENVLAGRVGRLAAVFIGLMLGWWVYVPIHELLHVGGCLATGGEVSELEIAPEYGGALWAKVFPFVVSGGDYAGRLSGFDDQGSLLVHLATVIAPYLLTILPGVWLMRWAANSGRPLVFGLSLPLALAPFLGLAGDAYEVGSLLLAEFPAWADERLVGDDIVRVIRAAPSRDALGVSLGAMLGCLWAWATWALGAAVARLLGRGPL